MGWEPEISRLIGWTEDPDDYYYVVQRRNGEIRLHSCVGGFVRLRDRLSGFEYEMVMNQWGRESIEDAMKKITEMKIVLK